MLASLDLDTAVELAANEILAIDLSRCVEGMRPNDILSLWTQALDVVQRDRAERDVQRLATRAQITVIQPGLESPVSLTNLVSVDRLLDQGEQLGEEVISAYMQPDGRFMTGTIHAPLHLHPFTDAPRLAVVPR